MLYLNLNLMLWNWNENLKTKLEKNEQLVKGTVTGISQRESGK